MASRRELETSARVAMGPFVSGLRKWDAFVTLSFDPWGMEGAAVGGLARVGIASREPVRSEGRDRYGRTRPRVTPATAQRRFAYFLDRAETVVGRPCEGLVALEHHKSGQPHGHGLLSIHGGLRKGDVRSLWDLWFGYRSNGYCRIEAPRSNGDVAGYCAKYMTKELGEITFSAGLGRRLR